MALSLNQLIDGSYGERVYEIAFSVFADFKDKEAVEKYIVRTLDSRGFDMSLPIDATVDNSRQVITYKQRTLLGAPINTLSKAFGRSPVVIDTIRDAQSKVYRNPASGDVKDYKTPSKPPSKPGPVKQTEPVFERRIVKAKSLTSGKKKE